MRPTHQTGDVHDSMTLSGDVMTAAAASTAVSGVSMQHCSTVTVSPSTELRLTADTHGRMQSLATLLAAVLMSVLMTVLTTFLWQFNSTFLPQCIIINYSHQQPGQRPHATPGTLQPPCSSPRRLSSLLKFLARGAAESGLENQELLTLGCSEVEAHIDHQF